MTIKCTFIDFYWPFKCKAKKNGGERVKRVEGRKCRLWLRMKKAKIHFWRRKRKEIGLLAMAFRYGRGKMIKAEQELQKNSLSSQCKRFLWESGKEKY